MDRLDPLRNFRFRLEIDGISQAGFSEVTIPEYGNITLKRGVAIGGAALDLFNWHAENSTGQVKIQRKKVVIVLQDEAGGEAARFVVTGAWPVKYDPSDLNAKGNEVAIELLELANDGIERVSQEECGSRLRISPTR